MSRAAKTSRLDLAALGRDADRIGSPELLVADTVGRLMEFWGFRAALGRVWTTLYLEPEPLPAPVIAERLSMSSSAVSLTLGELLGWGAVRKSRPPGVRQDHYEAETRIFRLVLRVIERRELALVREAIASFEAAELALRRRSEGSRDGRMRFVRRRLERLRRLAVVGEKLLRAAIAGRGLDFVAWKEAADLDREEGPCPP